MEEAFSTFKYEQQAQVKALIAHPEDWLTHHQLLDQATQMYLQLLQQFADYPPAVTLRLELADLIDMALPAAVVGEHLLRLLA